LTYLLSKPDGWRISREQLGRERLAGEFKIRRILKELAKYGYLSRKRIRQHDGTFSWENVVYEESPSAVESPVSEPPVGNPPAVNTPSNPNTDLAKTDLVKTEETKYPVSSNSPKLTEREIQLAEGFLKVLTGGIGKKL